MMAVTGQINKVEGGVGDAGRPLRDRGIFFVLLRGRAPPPSVTANRRRLKANRRRLEADRRQL